MSDSEDGIDLEAITDEQTLYKLLESTDDFDERKMIRARLQEVQKETRSKRNEAMSRREDDREQHLRQKKKDADDRKTQTLAMYDQMAKSAPAGGNKTMNINVYKSFDEGETGSPPSLIRRDLVEETIKARKQEADNRKLRILAAYDAAAKSGPAGATKIVDFDSFKRADVSAYTTPKPAGSCTFGSSGGIPQVKKQEEPNKNVSARAKFQQMDSAVKPNFTRPTVSRNPSDIKEMLLNWCKTKTNGYQNVKVENFSTSWNDGMAFCALIHHFYPEAFEFDTLNPKNRRHNFTLAFKVAEEMGDISPLLDVEDMVIMKKPDWKCVFTYVQSLYRHLHNKD